MFNQNSKKESHQSSQYSQSIQKTKQTFQHKSSFSDALTGLISNSLSQQVEDDDQERFSSLECESCEENLGNDKACDKHGKLLIAYDSQNAKLVCKICVDEARGTEPYVLVSQISKRIQIEFEKMMDMFDLSLRSKQCSVEEIERKIMLVIKETFGQLRADLDQLPLHFESLHESLFHQLNELKISGKSTGLIDKMQIFLKAKKQLQRDLEQGRFGVIKTQNQKYEGLIDEMKLGRRSLSSSIVETQKFIQDNIVINQQKCSTILGKRLRNIVNESFEIDIASVQDSLSNKRRKITQATEYLQSDQKVNHNESTAEHQTKRQEQDKSKNHLKQNEQQDDINSWLRVSSESSDKPISFMHLRSAAHQCAYKCITHMGKSTEIFKFSINQITGTIYEEKILGLDENIVLSKLISTADGRIFLLGGASNLGFSELFSRNTEIVYNKRLNTYTTTKKIDMLVQKASFGCIVDSFGFQIFTVGGVVKSDGVVRSSRACERYLVEQDLWAKLPNLCQDRFEPGLCFFNDDTVLYCFGGITMHAQKSRYETLDTIEKLEKKQDVHHWVELQVKLPQQCYNMGSFAVDNDFILLFGGRSLKSHDKCFTFWPNYNSISTTKAQLENGDSFMAHGVKVEVKQDYHSKWIVFGTEFVHLFDKEKQNFTTMQMQK